MSGIDEINQISLMADRLDKDASGSDVLACMKKTPFYGYIDIQLPGAEKSFFMFSSNDCAVSSEIFWKGFFCYESGSINLWRKLSGKSNVIVDCGAYTGIYSLVSSFVNNKSKIYSFEPVSFIRARLSMNAIINGFSNIKVFPCALGDHNNIIRLNIPFDPKIFTSGTSITRNNKTDYSEVAEIAEFDDLNLMQPDLVKIDAEGSEDLVLSGMKNSLKNIPFVFCEILGEKNPRDLLRFLPIGYDYFLIMEKGKKILTKNISDWRNNHGLNVLYFHKDKFDEIKNYISC